jgi:hypothetical protein
VSALLGLQLNASSQLAAGPWLDASALAGALSDALPTFLIVFAEVLTGAGLPAPSGLVAAPVALATAAEQLPSLLLPYFRPDTSLSAVPFVQLATAAAAAVDNGLGAARVALRAGAQHYNSSSHFDPLQRWVQSLLSLLSRLQVHALRIGAAGCRRRNGGTGERGLLSPAAKPHRRRMPYLLPATSSAWQTAVWKEVTCLHFVLAID